MRNSPVGSIRSSSRPWQRIQFKASSRSLARSSGLRRDSGTEPILSKDGISGSISVDKPWLLNQSSFSSISLARFLSLLPFFLGRIESSFRYSPVGSFRSSSSPLCLIQFKISCKSLARSSWLRREKGIDPIVSKGGMTSSSFSGWMPLFRIQSRALAISSALSSGVWNALRGKVESSCRKTPSGSYASSSFP